MCMCVCTCAHMCMCVLTKVQLSPKFFRRLSKIDPKLQATPSDTSWSVVEGYVFILSFPPDLSVPEPIGWCLFYVHCQAPLNRHVVGQYTIKPPYKVPVFIISRGTFTTPFSHLHLLMKSALVKGLLFQSHSCTGNKGTSGLFDVRHISPVQNKSTCYNCSWNGRIQCMTHFASVE